MPHCNIIIKDEVNVKLEGLDLVTRRKLTNKFKYEIPGARFMPAVRLGRWDGTVSFFSQGGLTYVNLLEDIVPILLPERAWHDVSTVHGRVVGVHAEHG